MYRCPLRFSRCQYLISKRKARLGRNGSCPAAAALGVVTPGPRSQGQGAGVGSCCVSPQHVKVDPRAGKREQPLAFLLASWGAASHTKRHFREYRGPQADAPSRLAERHPLLTGPSTARNLLTIATDQSHLHSLILDPRSSSSSFSPLNSYPPRPSLSLANSPAYKVSRIPPN